MTYLTITYSESRFQCVIKNLKQNNRLNIGNEIILRGENFQNKLLLRNIFWHFATTLVL